VATNLINNNNRPGTVVQQSKLLDKYVENYADDLGAGILPSFPVLSIRGGKWRVKYRGEETLIADDRGYPRPDIDVVIVMAPRHKSKAFYPEGFDENNPGVPPTCWSSDGKVPDAMVPEDQLQNDVCATCEQDKIGSAVTSAGKKTKACSDHKRVVVVPANDILNEAFGGPMLLRVPASSLKMLQGYGDYLKDNRALYFGCTTVLTFDPDPSFPRVQFEYGRPLDDTEVQMVLEMRESEQVKRILNEEIAATDPSTAEPTIEEEEATLESNPQPTVVQPQIAKSNVQPMRVAPQAPQKPVQPVQARPAATLQATPARPATAQPAQAAARPATAGFGGKPATAGTAQTGKQTGAFGGTKTTQAASTINAAVSRPAAPPPSTRQVAKPTQKELFEEPPMDGGEVPDELDAEFGKLMG
jgi:hypothetical protein